MSVRHALPASLLLLGIALHLLGCWTAATLHTDMSWRIGQLLVPALALGLARFLRRDVEPLLVMGVGTFVPFGMAVVLWTQEFAATGGIGSAEFHEGIALVFSAAAGLAVLGGLRTLIHERRPLDAWIGLLLLLVAVWWTWIWAVVFVIPLREQGRFVFGNEVPFVLSLAGMIGFVALAVRDLHRTGHQRLAALALSLGLTFVAGSAARMVPNLTTGASLLRSCCSTLPSRTGERVPTDRVVLRFRVYAEDVVVVRHHSFRPEELEGLLAGWHELGSDLTALVDVTSRTSLDTRFVTLAQLVEQDRVGLRVYGPRLPRRPWHHRLLGVVETHLPDSFLPLALVRDDGVTPPSLLLTRDGSGLRWEELPTPDHALLFQVDDTLTVADLVEGLDRLRETGREDYRLLVPDRR